MGMTFKPSLLPRSHVTACPSPEGVLRGKTGLGNKPWDEGRASLSQVQPGAPWRFLIQGSRPPPYTLLAANLSESASMRPHCPQWAVWLSASCHAAVTQGYECFFSAPLLRLEPGLERSTSAPSPSTARSAFCFQAAPALQLLKETKIERVVAPLPPSR